jgi:DNA-binding CsgD family transcriptional regulator
LDFALGAWFLDRGENEQVIEMARRSGGMARRFGMRRLRALALALEGVAYGRLGLRTRMDELLDEALTLADDEPVLAGLAAGCGRAVAALIDEERRRALEALELLMGHARTSPLMPPFPERGLWALLRTIADCAGAAACEEVRASGATVHRMNWAFLALAEAVRHGRAGRRVEAEAAFVAGDSALASVHWWRCVARRLVAEAAIDDGWGDPVAWLREALTEFEARDQQRLAAAARSLLQKAGSRLPRKRPDDGRIPPALREFGVSPRELEVLTLLAEGLRNKEIAERLYLSPRTVERHIANLTAKTGLRTRSELIALAARSVFG